MCIMIDFDFDLDFALIFPFLHHQAQAYFGVGRSHHLEYRVMEYMLTTIWLSLAFSYTIIAHYHWQSILSIREL